MPERCFALSLVLDGQTRGLGIALSGGGFRASLFNLGSLWRLNDAGWMGALDRVTSVSGGSITAAILGHKWTSLSFDGGRATNFVEEVASPLRNFCKKRVDIWCGIKGLANPLGRIADSVAATYDRALFHGATLQDLPEDGVGPRFVLYATNYQTGVSFRFSRPYLADYKLGMLRIPHVALSRAVAASSAFPPFLSPLILKTRPDDWDGGAAMPGIEKMRKRIVLADGGIYDNMGLEAIWNHKSIGIILVSDAGGPFAEKKTQWSLWPNQLGRVRNIMMEQTRALRRRMVLAELTSGRKSGSLWRIGTAMRDFQLRDPMCDDSDQTRSLATIRTRLNPFSNQEQGLLINWGYALADAALRRHVDPLLPKGSWPVPEFAL